MKGTRCGATGQMEYATRRLFDEPQLTLRQNGEGNVIGRLAGVGPNMR